MTRVFLMQPATYATLSPLTITSVFLKLLTLKHLHRCIWYKVAISHVAIAASFPASAIVQKKATWYETGMPGAFRAGELYLLFAHILS